MTAVSNYPVSPPRSLRRFRATSDNLSKAISDRLLPASTFKVIVVRTTSGELQVHEVGFSASRL